MEEEMILSPLFCDGMILQRDTENIIYGTEMKKEKVTVTFLNQVYESAVDENHMFSMKIQPVEAGGPYEINVCGSKEIKIKDVWFGDVYVLSGQSNMQLPMSRVLDEYADEVNKANVPLIRQYTVPPTYNFKEPETFLPASRWIQASNPDIMEFSAAGFFFAKELYQVYHVPIGLILTAVGGSRVETWMSPVALRKFGDFESEIERFKDSRNFYQQIENEEKAANQWSEELRNTEKQLLVSTSIDKLPICQVPSMVADYSCKGFQGSVFLVKSIYLEKEPAEEDAHIYMGTIIDVDTIWVNGQEIGSTYYRYPPRKYPISKGILKKGENRILIRIQIHNQNGGTVKGMPYHLYVDHAFISLEGDWHYQIGRNMEVPMPNITLAPELPIAYYNTIVVPISKYHAKGILWYQGESNSGTPVRYADKFMEMAEQWRGLYGYDIPIIFVQLPNYQEPLQPVGNGISGWTMIRDEQRKCLSLKNSAMVVTLDIGQSFELHPQGKKAVGIRLAMAAEKLIYHEKGTLYSPFPNCMKRKGSRIIILFWNLNRKDKQTNINNFEVAGEDGIYYTAQAAVQENQVSVWSEEVPVPIKVRYAWRDNPENINFYNEAGLPAASFQIKIEE